MRRTFRWQVLFLAELLRKNWRKPGSNLLLESRFAGFLFADVEPSATATSFRVGKFKTGGPVRRGN
jgi:hypothetical protein